MKSNPAYFKCFFRKKLFSHRIHINVRSFKGTINYLLQFYTEALHIYAYLKMAWKYLWLHLRSCSSIDRKWNYFFVRSVVSHISVISKLQSFFYIWNHLSVYLIFDATFSVYRTTTKRATFRNHAQMIYLDMNQVKICCVKPFCVYNKI